jgi:2-oxoglutarate ferredoxin oxidoreductase subunit alpha
MLDLNIVVGGEAGQGIQTIGLVLGKMMTRAGFHVFADQDYESRIRGGHNFFRVRISDREICSHFSKIDILVALNTQTIEIHRSEMKESSIIVGDKQLLKMDARAPLLFDIPLEQLAVQSSANKIMTNSVAIGAVAGLIKFDFNILADVLRWQFKSSSAEVKGQC